MCHETLFEHHAAVIREFADVVPVEIEYTITFFTTELFGTELALVSAGHEVSQAPTTKVLLP
jgi:hypothetical protein